MGNGRSSGHDEGIVLIAKVAGEFENAAGAFEQAVESNEAAIVKSRPVGFAVERQDRMEIEAKFESDFGADLVGSIGERRHEQEPWRKWREIARLLPVKLDRPILQFGKRGSDSGDDNLRPVAGECFDSVSGNPDRRREREQRWMLQDGVQRAGIVPKVG